MPLFFFISGLVFKPTGTKSLALITYKYGKQLLIPYYIFATLTYGFTLISQTAGDISLGGITYQLFGIFYGSGRDGMLGYNVVLWFLPCLFITKLTFAAITRKITQTKQLLIVLLTSAVSGYLLSFFIPWLKLPFGFEIALTGLTFFGAGYLLRIYQQKFKLIIQQKTWVAIVALLFTILIANINYYISGEKVDLRVNQLSNIFLFYLGSFGGIIGIIAMSRVIAKNGLLEYIGRHSMILFAWHNVLFTDLTNFISSMVTKDFLNNMKFIMPTFYAGSIISIILFSRMLVIKLKATLHFVSFLK